MKKIIPFLGLSLFLFSCGEETSSESNNKDSLVEVKKVDTLLREIETYFDWETITIEEFEKHKNNAEEVKAGGGNEKFHIDKNKDIVKRSDNRLIFSQGDKKEYLTDVTEEEVEASSVDLESKSHQYLGTFKNLSLVYIIYYEYYDYLFIDMSDFEKHSTWGYPRINEDSTCIIACNSDLMSGFTSNGIQFFCKENGNWSKKWELLISNFGPEEIYWVDNQTLVLKAYDPSPLNKENMASYYKLKFKQNS